MAAAQAAKHYRRRSPSARGSVVRYEPTHAALALDEICGGDSLDIFSRHFLKRLGKAVPGRRISRHQVHEAQREALIRNALERIDHLRVKLTFRAGELL